MAAKKKPAAKTTAKKVTKNPPVQTGRCPTCGMAPCNVPADMRKTGKPKAKAAPRVRKPKPEPELGSPETVVAEIPLPDDENIDIVLDDADLCETCPLCDEPEDSCICDVDNEETDE